MFLSSEKIKPEKVIAFFFLFISLVFILINCEKENARARSYPRVNTMPVSGINKNGAIFNGEISSLGTEKIIEHGFVWGITTDPDINRYNKILLGRSDSTGAYSAEIFTSLKKDIKYNVKSFVQTADHIVYGVAVDFKSLGSGAPTITSFEPHSAGWMDTVIIRGKNFSWANSENTVLLNQTICRTLSSTDTTLQVLISSELPDLKSILSVDLAGNVAVDTKDTFRLIAPVIQDFYPKQARWGDTITVTGKGLINERFNMTLSAAIGTSPSSIIERKNESIKFQVPLEVSSLENILSVKIQSLNLLFSTKIGLLPPYIRKIKPTEGTWGTILTLLGQFHPLASKNSIKIGELSVPIISFNKDSIKVAVPQDLDSHNNLIVNTSSTFTIVSPDTFKLFGPRIDSITPLAGVSNSTVTVRGNYFLRGNNFPKVKIGSINATVTGISPTRIDFTVPYPMNNGPVNITVTVGSQSTVFNMPYTVKNPVIKKVYPLTGTFNDEVTIEGENLLDGSTKPYVYFSSGSSSATIVTASQNKLVVKVPLDIDSISSHLRLYYYPNRLNFISTEYFVLSPPEIISVTPSIITTSGQDVVISGSNFHPSAYSNEVSWDIYPLIVKSSTVSQIIASLPTSMPRINGNIIVKIRGYKRSYPITNQVKSYWGRIPVPSTFIWNPGAGYYEQGVAFSINGIGYMMDYNSGNMTSFNPLTNEFRDLGAFSTFHQSPGMSVAVNRDTAYLIAGNLGVFRYDIAANNWISICASPTPITYGVAFSLNNTLYYGLTYSSSFILEKKLWCYDFKSRIWTLKNNLPVLMTKAVGAYFTIENKGYVILTDSKLWQYDPVTDVWSELAPYPRSLVWIVNKVAFVIDNKAYVGLGDVSTDELLKYDPLTNAWTLFTSVPGGRRSVAISFVVNNKAYVGFGILGYNRARDFYEFDPNYPVK